VGEEAKRCEVGHIWMADLPVCPYCHSSREMRVAMAGASGSNATRMAFGHQVDQPSLFATIPQTGTSRRDDPATSHAAAQSMYGEHLNAMQGEVLYALINCGGEGTLDDVTARTGRYPHTTSRRLTDLEQAGVIRKTTRTRAGRSGRQQIVWEVLAP
jgi:hypothetical protein